MQIEKVSVHGQIRHVEKVDKKHYLLPIMAKGELVMLNKTGHVVKRIHVGGNPFSVCPSAQKNIWWVACGDASKIVAVDIKKGEVVKEITNEDLAKSGVKLLFAAEVKELENGNLLVANWNGHSKDKTQPKLLVITPHGEVISKLPDNPVIKNISAFDF